MKHAYLCPREIFKTRLIVSALVALALSSSAQSVILSNFDYRPGITTPTVEGDYGVNLEYVITDRAWTAVRVQTGSVTTPGNVFRVGEVQIYIAGVAGSTNSDWGLALQVRENGFGPFADPETDTPNAASGAVVGELATGAPGYGSRSGNPSYEVAPFEENYDDNSFVFLPTGVIELQPDSVYWFSATSTGAGDRIHWKAATADGQKVLLYEGPSGWTLGGQTSDFVLNETDYWDEPLSPGVYDLPLLIEISAFEVAPSAVPEPANIAGLFGVFALFGALHGRRRR